MAAVLDFVDSDHDLIVAADANASDLIRNIATECGVDFDEASLTIFINLLFGQLDVKVLQFCMSFYVISCLNFTEVDISDLGFPYQQKILSHGKITS